MKPRRQNRGRKAGVPFELEFGHETLRICLPADTARLALPADPPLDDPHAAIRASLARPIGTPPLAQIVREVRRSHPDPRAVIVVSDNTRPVPYRGPAGLLMPLMDTLRREGVARIEILIANGTHRPLDDAEQRRLFPEAVFDGSIVITNHVCTDAAMLRHLGRTPRGTDVSVNTHYLDADIRILTGLVEPHFMAGASGGPKSVCPGITGEPALRVFHGPALMDDARSASLVLDGNPCHAEALAVARMAGVDFILNVTLNGARQVTGVFAGSVTEAHRAAVARVLQAGAIRIDREYDLVVTHAGFVGINHYQAAKAAVEAAKAVRSGGTIILAAHHTDVDPVGSVHYRRVLPMLRAWGPDGVTRRFGDPAWTFVPEQWEVQMWARAFRKIGPMDHLVYCAPALTGDRFRQQGVPGRDGGEGLPPQAHAWIRAQAMVQTAADRFLDAHPGAAVAVLPDGPYGVPVPGGDAGVQA